MKKVLFLACLLISLSCASQTVKQDASGNFVAVVKTKKADNNTGKTFTDAKGNVWPVFLSEKGKFYALRMSKSGKEYRQYLTVK